MAHALRQIGNSSAHNPDKVIPHRWELIQFVKKLTSEMKQADEAALDMLTPEATKASLPKINSRSALPVDSLVLLSQATIEPSEGEHRGTLVYLHPFGTGSSRYLQARAAFASKGIRLVFPIAPRIPIAANDNQAALSWFDYFAGTEAGKEPEPDPSSLEDARTRLALTLEREAVLLGPDGHKRLLIGGCGQGGTAALHAALMYQETLAGFVGVCSELLPCSPWQGPGRLELHFFGRTQDPDAWAQQTREPLVLCHNVVDHGDVFGKAVGAFETSSIDAQLEADCLRCACEAVLKLPSSGAGQKVLEAKENPQPKAAVNEHLQPDWKLRVAAMEPGLVQSNGSSVRVTVKAKITPALTMFRQKFSGSADVQDAQTLEDIEHITADEQQSLTQLAMEEQEQGLEREWEQENELENEQGELEQLEQIRELIRPKSSMHHSPMLIEDLEDGDDSDHKTSGREEGDDVLLQMRPKARGSLANCIAESSLHSTYRPKAPSGPPPRLGASAKAGLPRPPSGPPPAAILAMARQPLDSGVTGTAAIEAGGGTCTTKIVEEVTGSASPKIEEATEAVVEEMEVATEDVPTEAKTQDGNDSIDSKTAATEEQKGLDSSKTDASRRDREIVKSAEEKDEEDSGYATDELPDFDDAGQDEELANENLAEEEDADAGEFSTAGSALRLMESVAEPSSKRLRTK
eukprot:TRINITY_DN39285_c0_g1_i1.p1 TRINITY_DN39285_c0_g1~~TRINITY_DN39285_c0_g1_i1.p1  ORF type:complete len:757 (+),score=189.56 TRINITY_DN39285_c0_g1_i1:200-2272(+)